MCHQPRLKHSHANKKYACIEIANFILCSSVHFSPQHLLRKSPAAAFDHAPVLQAGDVKLHSKDWP